MRTGYKVRVMRGLAFVAVAIPLAPLGCGRDREEESVSFNKNYDLKKEDPRSSATPVPPAVEILKPAAGTKIKPKAPVDVLVRIRLVPGSRIPNVVMVTLQGRPPCYAPAVLGQFRQEGDEYHGTVRVDPPSTGTGWINDEMGRVTVQVSMVDVMTIWDGSRHEIKETKWQSKPVYIEALRQ